MIGIIFILVFWLLGELIAWLTGEVIPGNVIGMVLLFIALQVKVVKEEKVEAVATFLMKNMALFFLPPGVGLIVAWSILRDHWLTILLAIIVSTIAVIMVVGKVYQAWRHGKNS